MQWWHWWESVCSLVWSTRKIVISLDAHTPVHVAVNVTKIRNVTCLGGEKGLCCIPFCWCRGNSRTNLATNLSLSVQGLISLPTEALCEGVSENASVFREYLLYLSQGSSLLLCLFIDHGACKLQYHSHQVIHVTTRRSTCNVPLEKFDENLFSHNQKEIKLPTEFCL